jgi:hypothetical protein
MTRSKRPIPAVIVLALFALTAVATAAAAPAKDVVIRVFRIAAEQQVEIRWPIQEGETAILTMHGEMTANFPHGLVILDTELSVAASESAVGQVIQERMVFGRGALIPQSVRVEEIPALRLRLAGAVPSARSRVEEKRGESHSDDIELQASWKSAAGEPARTRVAVSAGWTSSGGRLGVGFSGWVFDRTIDVPDDKLELIGFRSLDQKTVLWLAVSAVPGSPAKAETK